MIKGLFKFGGDLVEVIVDGGNLLFNDVSSGVMSPIEGLRLDKAGALKEHPDLIDNKDWKKETIKRFKKHVSKFKSEDDKIEYVKIELKNYGYEALTKQKAGWRPKKWR